MTNRPAAPANRSDLKSWTLDQLTYAAPFWVARLEDSLTFDAQIIASIMPNTQPWLDALNIRHKHQQQLTFWKLVLSDKTRVLPPCLRTFYRQASYNECGLVKRSCTVGSWDKARGIWPE